jgi:hypothetical protein
MDLLSGTLAVTPLVPGLRQAPTSNERNPMATMFEFAVVLDEKRDKDGEVVEGAEMVVEPQAILARDADQAKLKAARAIPDELVNDGKLDRLVVVVRPF